MWPHSLTQACHFGEYHPRHHLKGENKIKQCSLWWKEVHSKKLPIAHQPTTREGEAKPWNVRTMEDAMAWVSSGMKTMRVE